MAAFPLGSWSLRGGYANLSLCCSLPHPYLACVQPCTDHSRPPHSMVGRTGACGVAAHPAGRRAGCATNLPRSRDRVCPGVHIGVASQFAHGAGLPLRGDRVDEAYSPITFPPFCTLYSVLDVRKFSLFCCRIGTGAEEGIVTTVVLYKECSADRQKFCGIKHCRNAFVLGGNENHNTAKFILTCLCLKYSPKTLLLFHRLQGPHLFISITSFFRSGFVLPFGPLVAQF